MTTLRYFAAPYHNLCVSSAEAAINSRWDVVLCVDDRFPDYTIRAQQFWAPISDTATTSLAVHFMVKRVLDRFALEKRTLVHCEFGLRRSPFAVFMWLRSRGMSSAAADTVMGGDFSKMFEAELSEAGPVCRLHALMNHSPNAALGDLLGKLHAGGLVAGSYSQPCIRMFKQQGLHTDPEFGYPDIS